MQLKKVRVYADGGARNNPGPAAIGIVMFDDQGNTLEHYKEYIGIATNNIAEYKALIKALDLSARYTHGEVRVFMDSELVVRQMNGRYRIKTPHLLPLYTEAKAREVSFEKVVYRNVPREDAFQALADSLVNAALDQH